MRVLLIRANRNDVDCEALATRGVDCLVDPYLEIVQVDNAEGAQRLLRAITRGEASWLVISSLNALDYWTRQLPPGALATALQAQPTVRVAAIGQSTAAAARELGVEDVLTPDKDTSRVLADRLVSEPPGVVVVPSGSISMRSIPNTLVPRGFSVMEEVFYSTGIVTNPPLTASSLAEHDITDVLFRSPSAVRAFVHFHPNTPEGVRYIATGPTTAEEMERHGLPVAAVSADSTPDTVADTVASLREERQ